MEELNDTIIQKRIRVSLTEKDQLTLPPDVKRILHPKRKGKLEFVIEKNGRVYLEPVKYTLEDVFMSVKPVRPGGSWKEVEEDAHEQQAQDYMKKQVKE